MKDIQLLHKGKVYHGQVGYDQPELMEVTVMEEPHLPDGDSVLCFDFKRRQTMRVLHNFQSKVILAPSDSELFHIKASSGSKAEEWLVEESATFTNFKLNTYGTITDDFKISAVRISDVSRFGIGFEVNDFSIKMHHVYNSMIICDEECIYPKLIVRYAHILEKTIRYGAEIHSISSGDLNKLRYYVAMQQFKHTMLV
ncbi:hypothetical protein DVH26_07435 [Paenibacillus sp. H1-7]|uniref:hypothetical protein n=1 Tax=Paenibacillus sp. H1-7 TaxID=2282849 RepID=UPI001EF78759|nr:hypothetical protein [Paenibacillus sp. H1-7]ULL14292.1 hypothetical protein DVH26_07435 [Paenibacillus sp. H1-7]